METKQTAKSTSTKKSSAKDPKEMKDVALEKIKLGLDELDKIVKDLKGKYDKVDDKTKKKVLTGVAGAAAILGGIIAGAAISKKLKK